MRKIKFNIEYLSLGMMQKALEDEGDLYTAQIYENKINDYLDAHQYAMPAKVLMYEEANRLNHLGDVYNE